MTAVRQRVEPIRSQVLRRSAKGQRCTLNLPGICNYDEQTVVLAHIHDEQFGKSQKADDTSSMFCCFACHSAYDLHRTGLDEAALLKMVLRAHFRTLRRWVLLQLVAVPLDAAKPFHTRPVPARKPPEQRKPVPAGRPLQGGRKLQSANNLRKSERPLP